MGNEGPKFSISKDKDIVKICYLYLVSFYVLQIFKTEAYHLYLL